MQRPAVLCALLAASGCVEFGVDPIDEDVANAQVVVVDEFRQEPLPAVDLLFVVDNTASMAQEQADLAAHFAALADRLGESEIAWHAGVVSTDVTGADAGWLQGDPWLVGPSVDDAVVAFADNVQVGTDSTAPEAGIAAALLALELSEPGGPNAGFRRPDAALHVVFVSDADDESDDWLESDPVGALLEELATEASNGLPAMASAIVGPVPSGCVSELATAQPGHRYVEAADSSGGIHQSICSPDFGEVLDALGVATISYRTSFTLRAAPVPDSVVVDVDGSRLEGGWLYTADPPTVTFDEPPAPSARIVVTYLVELDP